MDTGSVDSTRDAAMPPRAARPLVVGLGASAGGLDPVREIVRALTPGHDLAVVVLFHLDPAADGLLTELVEARASLPVVAAADGQPLEPDRIYVVPAHHEVRVAGGHLRLTPADQADARRTPIDRLLYSIAHDAADRSAAIIVSGTGSDGALGLKAVSDAGGVTFVQDPATARHDGMPRSAIATGAADHVLAPGLLGAELVAYADHVGRSAGTRSDHLAREEIPAVLPTICELLLEATGHNFKHYKTSTLVRRTLRRLQVLRLPTARAYVERLRADPTEVEALFRDLLIGVTAFFRDPEAFEALARDVLPRLLAGRRPDDGLRVWVPGCATGEEAYTVAMLLHEALEASAVKPDVQIFATDIDEQALAYARQGVYPQSIADEVPPERLRRFFVRKGQQFHVAKELRDRVLFSVHNLINDPPFSRIDLISCRNLLIYLGPHLQKKLIPLFHYALRPGGFLFLGPSESLTAHRELFKPVDQKHRLSQRLPTAIRPPGLVTSRAEVPSLVRPPNVSAPSETDTYLYMQRIVLDEFAPKSLVVNEDGQVVCASGNLERYLSVGAGAFHNNVVRLAHEGLRVGLRAALSEAAKIRRRVMHDNLSVQTEQGVQRVLVTVQPMPQMGEETGLFLVVFQDVGLPGARDERARATLPDEDAARLIEQLERELAGTREDLEKTIQDLEAANEELKSSNEELLSMNEELQSANEELETSKEEVQAANEALTRTNTDLENLLASTEIATLFLDADGNIRRFTPSVTALYNLLPGDVGRPLSHLTHKALAMPPLPAPGDVRAGAAREDEVELLDGRWFLRRVLPYRTHEGREEGIVVTFTDVSETKRVESALRASEARLTQLLEATSDGIWDWNLAQGTVEYGPRLLLHLGYDRAEVPATTAFWRSLRHPDDAARVQEELDAHLAGRTPVFMSEHRLRHHDGHFLWMVARGRVIARDALGRPTRMVGTYADIDARKHAEAELRLSEERLRLAQSVARIGSWEWDPAESQAFWSEGTFELFGIAPGEPRFQEIWDGRIHRDDRKKVREALREAAGDGAVQFDYRYELPDGRTRWIHTRTGRAGTAGREGFVYGVSYDVTERREAELEREKLLEQARRTVQFSEQFIGILSHDLRNPLAAILTGTRGTLRGDLDQRLRTRLELVARAGERMARMIDQLLDLTRVRMGRGLPLDRRPGNVVDTLERVLAEIRAANPERTIDVHVSGDASGLWDAERLAQALSNLLGNALQHGSGGPVRVDLDATNPALVELRVHNTGVFPEELREHAFEPLKPRPRHGGSGLGLGLYITAQVVHAHGGSIAIESAPATGTTLRVGLPREAAAEPKSA